MVEEKRIVLGNTGKIDPERIEDYISAGGYEAFNKAAAMDPHSRIPPFKLSACRVEKI